MTAFQLPDHQGEPARQQPDQRRRQSLMYEPCRFGNQVGVQGNGHMLFHICLLRRRTVLWREFETGFSSINFIRPRESGSNYRPFVFDLDSLVRNFKRQTILAVAKGNLLASWIS
jgi:hypothetical protein